MQNRYTERIKDKKSKDLALQAVVVTFKWLESQDPLPVLGILGTSGAETHRKQATKLKLSQGASLGLSVPTNR